MLTEREKSLIDAVERGYGEILKYAERPDVEELREGLRDTPRRVAKAYVEMFSGYKEDPADILSRVFEEDGCDSYRSMIIVKDVPFYSQCEHHIVPFFGTADVGYVPGEGKGVVGLSKLARLVDCFAKRLQVQERMTDQIANAIESHLQPLGCMVVIRAEHLCMCARGVKKPGSQTVTSAVRGVFREDAKVREEFLLLTQGGR
jgi:GTP cyclohydrolase I